MSRRVHENKLKKNIYRTNNTVSKNLRFLRLVYGYTQQEIADILGIGRTAYHAIEHGGRQLDLELISILADFYEIDINYLVTLDICEQIMTMIKVDQERIRASVFLDRYFSLSRSGREQIRDEILGIAEHERLFKRFPWKYEGFEELTTSDVLYEKRYLYEERLRKEKKL